jgi:magnesium-transporting ATPase (P-type)
MPFFGNRYLISGLVLVVFLHFGVIYIPFLQNIFSTLALSFNDWLKIIAVGSSIFWLEELRKFIARKREVGQAKIS